MIKVKFTETQKAKDNFNELVSEVLEGLRTKTEITMHGFTLVPVQVALEGATEDLTLNVEGYIK
jgi:hypothetical protein